MKLNDRVVDCSAGETLPKFTDPRYTKQPPTNNNMIGGTFNGTLKTMDGSSADHYSVQGDDLIVARNYSISRALGPALAWALSAVVVSVGIYDILH